MNFNDYQKNIEKNFVIYPKDKIGDIVIYPVLGLAGEAGEVTEKFKKLIRDKQGKLTPEDKESISLELGDVLWYVSRIASEMGIELQTVVNRNINKLQTRKEKDKLQGAGDNR